MTLKAIFTTVTIWSTLSGGAARAVGKVVAATFMLLALTGCHCGQSDTRQQTHKPPPSIEQSEFGRLPDGTPVKLFTMRNANGMRVAIMERGATITGVWVPDRNGHTTRVVMGVDSLQEYLKGFGASAVVIGRYANRISHGRFTIDGVDYQLITNNGAHFLHGGKKSFAAALWQGEIDTRQPNTATVLLRYMSKDGDDGFPGTVHVTVAYTLTNDNELRIDYQAQSDKPTPINLTNHAYFNLAGQGEILDTLVYINADKVTKVDNHLIPTGAFEPVTETPLDFTTPHKIGARLARLEAPFSGYDHNYVLNPVSGTNSVAAWACNMANGCAVAVYTDQPGMQFYIGKRKLTGSDTSKASGDSFNTFCFETQHFPDSPNHPHFPSTILRPGEQFQSFTTYRFYTRD